MAPAVLTLRTRIAGTLALALLAYFGSILNLPLVFGVTFIFGSIMAMFAIALLGTLPGLLVGFAGGLYTVVLFGHPYALIIFSMEALVVGLLYRRGMKNLVLADLSYWLAIGIPLVLSLYVGVIGMDWTPAGLIALKQPLNGLFNALIASLILLGLQLYWRNAFRLGLPAPKLPSILFHTVLTLVLLAGTIPIIHKAHDHRALEEAFLNEKMGDTVQRLTRTFETQGPLDVSLQQALLNEAQTASGMTLALLDADGHAIAHAGKLGSTDKPGNYKALTDELSIWLPSGKIPTMKRWKQGYYQYRLPVPGTHTTLMAETSAAPLIEETERDQLYLFAFLSALLLGGILIARMTSQWLTRPLSALEASSSQLSKQIAEGAHPVLPVSPIQEYDNLSNALRNMAEQLADNFHELHRIQNSLEDQIQARTSELKNSQQLLLHMLETSPIAARIAHMGGHKVIYSNPRYVKLINADDAQGLDPATYYAHPEDYDDVLNRLNRGEQIFDRLIELTIPKTGTKWTLASYLPIQYQGESAVLGWFYDITELKQAEMLLKDQAQRTQAILDNAVDGIITIDQNGLVSSINKSAMKIFGYTPAEVIGQNVMMLMPEPYSGTHDDYLHNYITSGHAKIIGIGREVAGQRKDGETFPMNLAISEISHNGQRMFIGMVRDITEQKLAERMKNEFVSTVSHELRTPLTSISGSIALINSGTLGELPEQIKVMLDIAYKNSLTLANLINDLLDMEKIAAGKLTFNLQKQAIQPLLEQAIAANKNYGEQYGVHYALTKPADGIQVLADAQRLIQVLSNFLSNAAKFSPVGSSVEIEAQTMGNRIRVSVIDHGPGIPANFRGRIFQKFTQADASDTRQKGGTGLGLAISKELIEHMGGSIGYESEPGQGSTFFFELLVQS